MSKSISARETIMGALPSLTGDELAEIKQQVALETNKRFMMLIQPDGGYNLARARDELNRMVQQVQRMENLFNDSMAGHGRFTK
jgi:hypothetical protein